MRLSRIEDDPAAPFLIKVSHKVFLAEEMKDSQKLILIDPMLIHGNPGLSEVIFIVSM